MLMDVARRAGEWNLQAEASLIRYVLGRECPGGGFCFYRLDEPNGSDTWFALSILHALHVPFRRAKTKKYLQGLQRPDGSFDSLYTAYYAVRSLQLLSEALPLDARSYACKHLKRFVFSADNLPPEVTSMFRRLRYLLELKDTLGLALNHETAADILRFVRSFRNTDGGYGHGRSSLSDTAEAMQILQRLACPVSDSRARDFISSCEMPVAGFVNVPGTSLVSIEAVHDGLLCATLVSHRPRYLSDCLNFIRFCRNNTGGFTRSTCTGIATLENSFFAVHALGYAQTLRNHRLKRDSKTVAC